MRSLGTYPFSRRLHILARWSANGSSATDALREGSFWEPDTVWIWSAALHLGGELGEWAEAALLLTVLGESPVELLSFGGSVRKEHNVHLEILVLLFHLNCLIEMVHVGGYVKTETFKLHHSMLKTHRADLEGWCLDSVVFIVHANVWENSSRSCVSVMWNPSLLPLNGSECQLGCLVCCHWCSLLALLQMNHPQLHFSCLPDLISLPDTTCSCPLNLASSPICSLALQDTI